MASSSGPRFPTAHSADGSGNNGSWINGANIYAEDGSTADSSYWLDMSGFSITDSGVLTGSSFGFTIPSGSTIRGIVLEVKRSGIQASEEGVYLTNGGGTSSNKAGTGGGLTTGLSWATYGGATDLWGTTWTPAEINSTSFGAAVSFQETHDPADSSAHVDVMRITVYYDPPVIPVDPAFQKSYLYKTYSPSGQYLGNLPKVTSEFALPQDINTAGSQVTVVCGVSADTAALPSSGAVLDETGSAILDESSGPILSEGSAPIVGAAGSGALIQNGNQVVVVEYSYYHINGIVKYYGEIENWQADFGGASGDEQIKILLYPNSTDLDNRLLTGSPFTYTADQSQTAQNATGGINNNTADKGSFYNFYGQTFTVGSGVTNLGRIDLLLAGAANVTVKVFSAPNTLPVLASSTVNVNTGGGAAVVSFAFPAHITVTPGASYFFSVEVDNGQGITIYMDSANPYSGGVMQNASYAGGGGGSYGPVSGYDLYFVTYSSSGNTIATFTSMDPSTGMLEAIMNDYLSRGGSIGYNSSTIDATGLSLTAGFNTNTVLEGIKEILQIAPDGFYWYIDQGTNLLYFKQASTTADVILEKSVHIDHVTFIATIENVVNVVYFSGGDTGSGNLYKLYQDGASAANFGQRLDRVSNNRVTQSGTADAIGNSEIAERKNEIYATTVTVVDKTMDISSLHVGQVVGFRGFGTFVDGILSQIVHIDYSPNEASLTLGILPVRQDVTLESVTRDLLAQQTIANPSTPS